VPLRSPEQEPDWALELGKRDSAATVPLASDLNSDEPEMRVGQWAHSVAATDLLLAHQGQPEDSVEPSELRAEQRTGSLVPVLLDSLGA